MCKIRLSQKALKHKILSVFSQTLFENGRRRTGRSGGKAAEGEESGWDLESSGMFNSIQLSRPLLYQHTKLFFLPHSLSCSLHTSRRSFHLWAVQWTTSTHHAGTTTGTARFVQGEPDHRLSILGSTHPQAPACISLHSVIFTVSKLSSQTTICLLTSPHPPETQWQMDPASNLPHSHQQRPPKSQAVALHSPCPWAPWGQQSWAYNAQNPKAPQQDSRVSPTWLQEQSSCCHPGHVRKPSPWDKPSSLETQIRN